MAGTDVWIALFTKDLRVERIIHQLKRKGNRPGVHTDGIE